MKKFIMFILLFLISINSQASDLAIDTVKSHKEITHFLKDKPLDKYQVTYQQIELGGVCGFAGCHWRKLVSVIVTSKSSNSATTTILALVEGKLPSQNNPPTVSFINLKNRFPNTLVFVD